MLCFICFCFRCLLAEEYLLLITGLKFCTGEYLLYQRLVACGSFLEHCMTCSSLVVGRILDASLSASASPDCSLKMAFVLTQVHFSC